MKKLTSFIAGFLILFAVYHFPEFFKPFWITAVFKIGFLIVAIILCRLQGWKGLQGYGISFTNKWYSTLLIGLLVGIIAFILAIGVSISLKFEQLVGIERPAFFFNHLPLTLLITFFPSIAEDILTRGYLYGHLKFLRPAAWVLISATIYVLNHIWRLNDGMAVLSYLFMLGLVLGLSVIVKRSLWLALGIHWGANIAFELSNAGLNLNTVSNQQAPTWCIAAVWGLVLLALIFFYRNSLKKAVKLYP